MRLCKNRCGFVRWLSHARRHCRPFAARVRARFSTEVRAVNGAVSELTANTLLVVGALFPIVNPLGNAPIFLTLTRGLSGQGRTKLARAIAVNGLVLLVVSIF